MHLMRYLVPMLAAAALAACASTQEIGAAPEAAMPASGPLDGERWKLAGANAGPMATLEHARRVTMEFDEGRVYGYGGCNRYQGSYTVTGTRLDIGQVASTKMFCHGEGSEVEEVLHELFKQPFDLVRTEAALHLRASDGTQLRFIRITTQ